ncbi:hypothetical protein U9M48_022037 [Paspalum notatum var. saurae]|uniref:Uncharacterized protein n=1 Tax=Paspalum notatum var. saurae TaxID=547442 RepID=A0AAQ3WUL4_PASNO
MAMCICNSALITITLRYCTVQKTATPARRKAMGSATGFGIGALYMQHPLLAAACIFFMCGPWS